MWREASFAIAVLYCSFVAFLVLVSSMCSPGPGEPVPLSVWIWSARTSFLLGVGLCCMYLSIRSMHRGGIGRTRQLLLLAGWVVVFLDLGGVRLIQGQVREARFGWAVLLVVSLWAFIGLMERVERPRAA